MIDKATKVQIDRPDALKVHGHTKIILTDTRTGKQKTFEHSNTFQSAILAAQLRGLGVYNNSPFDNDTWAGRPLWRNLCGGILLFKDEIQAPAEYMPAGNQMVANGTYGLSNNGTPAELGSFNSIESSVGNNSVSFVYDWGTSQGNGTISCVCLTSEIGGRIGYGNPSGEIASSLVSLTANQNSRTFSAGIPYKNKLFSFVRDKTNKKITVTISDKAIDEATIFSERQVTEEYTYTSDLPNTVGAPYITADYLGSGKFMLSPYSTSDMVTTVPVNGTFVVLIYDAEAKTLTEKTITNNSSNPLRLVRYNTTLMYFSATGSKFFAITASGQNDSQMPLNVIDIDGGNPEEINENLSISRSYINLIAPDLVGLRGTNGALWIYDMVAKTCLPTNAVGTETRVYSDENDALYTSKANGGGLYKNPLYLATINNLDSPVTKDSTQTMKVIYTLTEASV